MLSSQYNKKSSGSPDHKDVEQKSFEGRAAAVSRPGREVRCAFTCSSNCSVKLRKTKLARPAFSNRISLNSSQQKFTDNSRLLVNRWAFHSEPHGYRRAL
jgi:hypothetical protein